MTTAVQNAENGGNSQPAERNFAMMTPIEEAEIQLSRQSSCLAAILFFMGTDARKHEPELEDVQVFLQELKYKLDEICELLRKGD